MKIEDCIQKIEKYLLSNNNQPRIVNIENIEDIFEIKDHFNVGNNVFLKASDYCKADEYPQLDRLFNDLMKLKGNVFITGLTTFFKLKGEEELNNQIIRIIQLAVPSCHIIILCYQCSKYLPYEDVRYGNFIYNVDGDTISEPELVFVSPHIPLSEDIIIEGIHNITDVIESSNESIVHIVTKKRKYLYPKSIYIINEENNAFDVLCKLDIKTCFLKKEYGFEDQWFYALEKISKYKTWDNCFRIEYGGYANLNIIIGNWMSFDSNQRWMYFVMLKLYGSPNSWCLSVASKMSNSVDELIRCIFRSILSLNCDDNDYRDKYLERKNIINFLGNPIDEIIDYCGMVKSKGQYALYYLTDNSRIEKELMFELLDLYGLEIPRSDLEKMLDLVYPDLYSYLKPYRFKYELLNNYFHTYKYEKVINKIFPEFEFLVEEQAHKREFNLILPSRSEKIEEIEKEGTQLYFIDAMGVEFLSFIMEKCYEKGLTANVTVCRSELPSLTSYNKEFLNSFDNVISIKKIDDIKHNGEENFNYQQTKLPIHLIRELEIIEEVIDNIKIKLAREDCTRAVMVSDHGASRLAVIKENTLSIDVNSKGKHGGRVCEFNDGVEEIKGATQAGEYYVLANYDRFKGGRAASVETHGGATLEEVTVPIIEITYSLDDIEIEILTPLISVSYRKKAEIKLFSKTKLKNLNVFIDGRYYDAESTDDINFIVKMPDIKQAKEYSINIYTQNNMIASGLKFKIQKEVSKEIDLL